MQAANVTNMITGGLAYQWQHPTRFTYCNGYVAAWHGMSMNTLFPDGHVERIPQSLLTSNSVQSQSGVASSTGALFWNDGKGAGWFANQFPGYTFPTSYQ